MMYPIFTNKILDDELFTTFIISQLFVNRLLGNLLEYLRLITGLFSAAASSQCWVAGGDNDDLQGGQTLSPDP